MESDTDAFTAMAGILAADAWFRSLPAALQAKILQRSVVRVYRRGAMIWAQESKPKGMCGVLEGRVRITRLLPSGDENLFHVGEPGFWFGHLSLVTSEKTEVSAIADTDVRLLMLTRAQSDLIGAEEPDYYKHLAVFLGQRYAALLRSVSYGKLMTPEERVRARLAELLAVQHSAAPPPSPVRVNVSQADLAAITGVSRQTLNELLGRLEREGIIEIGFRHICVLDPTRL